MPANKSITIWKIILLSAFITLNSITWVNAQNTANNLTQFVDPYIGTGFHGHVFVGANVPFGAVQLGPTNLSTGWDWCSGYHISDSTIIGFQHTHLSGTGIGDLGDISVMPTTGELKVTKGTIADIQSGYVSLFDRKDEVVKPGYYAVRLKRYDIGVRLTASTRVGFHEYTFPKNSRSHIIIDLEEGIGRTPVSTSITLLNSNTITGYRYTSGWAKDKRVYFAAVFSKPVKNFAVYNGNQLTGGTSLTATKVKGVVSFETLDGEKVYVKVGLSPISTENALLNIAAEIPGWDFEQVRSSADKAWNKQLQKVMIKTGDAGQLKIFYTALYHTMIAPSTFNDANGDYWGTDKQVHRKATFTNLTTFSLWDTYRAANPLYTLIQPERMSGIINSLLAIYQQQGRLPVWPLMANETNTMPGNSAIPIIVDAYLKGYQGFDAELAYQAVKTTNMGNIRGLNFIKQNGFIPADSTVESVAMGLEYAIDDAAIAKMALRMNKQADYLYFKNRANNYQNYFDQQTHFMRGRLSAHQWRTPFNPFKSVHMKDDYTEGNAWQYTWLVPQDVNGLIKLQGGDKAFNEKLDSLFIAQGDMGPGASNDISGLIGQYAHGNEPSHHIAYLYSYSGQPWKTAEKVRYIMNNFYTVKPDGIIGNEDVGQMSAWYILSSMGFYQVDPADGGFVFGSPLFNEVTLTLSAKSKMHIIAKNNSSQNIYIQKAWLNGKPHSKTLITYTELKKGGELIFEMGPKPNLAWGTKPADRPHSDPH
ncbi:GH92 family glycosyl hydrolase [Mucilaginibacter paludis]|uniref:Alpha-1,2-mannosidase n=1 Tax=Mucilaginibacter paludis DSM 18603 TaxID=714943 RepID=H1Y8C2_9SPHI|nr:GH92 family glycosyl hydrolase [Mucilaginibacter paludis]EHQ24941.1 alpha-1,2-mannosidase [Mucilaginibacter paludis DSM 18603]